MGSLDQNDMLELLPDSIVIVNAGGKIERANERAEILFEYAHGEMVGLSVEALIPARFRGNHLDLRREYSRSPYARPIRKAGTLWAQKKGGSEFPVEISLGPLRDNTVMAVIRDISEKLQAEQTLRESESRYRSLVQLSPEAVVVHRRGEILWSNNAGATLLGVAAPEVLIGRSLLEFIPLEQREFSLGRIADPGAPLTSSFPSTLTIRRQNGTILYLEATVGQFAYQGEQAAQIILRDVTAQRKAELESLRVSRAAEANTAVDQLLIRVKDEDEFLQSACKRIQELGLFEFVWIGLAEHDQTRTIRAVARAGNEDGYLSTFSDSWDASSRGFEPVGVAMRTGRPFAVRDVSTDLRLALFRQQALKRGFASLLGLPLFAGGELLGGLGICSAETNAFNGVETARLVQVAEDLAYGVATLRARRARDHAEAELRASREELRNLSSYLQSAREAERTAVAREIHDELGQTLTALKMDTSWLSQEIDDRLNGMPEELKVKLSTMETLIDRTIQTVRRIATELRPVLLDSLGLAPALEWLADDFANRTGIACSLQVQPEDFDLDGDRSTALFRICQEALTNVARHANASAVTIGLTKSLSTIVLRVADNGKGIPEGQKVGKRSYGLLGMKERVILLHGSVDIEGKEGQGTTVTATLPVET
ncbi:MAG: PAS domain S-box protein [Bacteroidota bacterium]